MNELELDNYHGIDELINELHTRGHDWLRASITLASPSVTEPLLATRK